MCATQTLLLRQKYRLNNLDVDYITGVGELQELIKDDYNVTLPEIITTERVESSTQYLLQGRCVVVFNGSPYVLIMPATIFDFLQTPERFKYKSRVCKSLRANTSSFIFNYFITSWSLHCYHNIPWRAIAN